MEKSRRGIRTGSALLKMQKKCKICQKFRFSLQKEAENSRIGTGKRRGSFERLLSNRGVVSLVANRRAAILLRKTGKNTRKGM